MLLDRGNSVSEKRGGYLVVQPSGNGVRRILKETGDNFKYAYIGEDVSKSVLVDGEIGSIAEKIEIGGHLQKTASALRKPFIDYIGELSKKNNSLLWWAGRLSEKSPHNSKVFLHACYVKVCNRVVAKNHGQIVFFVEDESVRKALVENLPKAIHLESPANPILKSAICLKDFAVYKFGFLLNNFFRIIISKYHFRMQDAVDFSKPGVLMHTFVDKRSFNEKGKYNDIYFKELPKWLGRKGKRVIFFPHVINKFDYHTIVSKIKNCKDEFLIPHSVLSFSDVIGVFFETLKDKPGGELFPKLCGMDINEIISEDLKKDWIHHRKADAMLLNRLVKRLKEKNLDIEELIHIYENHTWEKVLNASMLEEYADSSIIAYQHATFSKMFLHFFFSKKELGIIPLPHRIVTNGPYYAEVLLESGYPKGCVASGGSIRFAHVRKQKVRAGKKAKKTVLVTLSIAQTEAEELLWKAKRAFESKGAYDVIIKCHPLTPFKKISRVINSELPRNFTVSNASMPNVLSESAVLVYTSSTTCIEALAAGIPVIQVQSDSLVDLDILDLFPDARLSARTPEELRNCVDKALRMNKRELANKRKKWQSVVKEMFGKADESTFRLFQFKKKKSRA